MSCKSAITQVYQLSYVEGHSTRSTRSDSFNLCPETEAIVPFDDAGSKQPNETLDSLDMGYCPSMGRLTLTVTTDMLVKDGGPGVQAVRMWTKQWTFTAAGAEDGTSGCTVTHLALPL